MIILRWLWAAFAALLLLWTMGPKAAEAEARRAAWAQAHTRGWH